MLAFLERGEIKKAEINRFYQLPGMPLSHQDTRDMCLVKRQAQLAGEHGNQPGVLFEVTNHCIFCTFRFPAMDYNVRLH